MLISPTGIWIAESHVENLPHHNDDGFLAALCEFFRNEHENKRSARDYTTVADFGCGNGYYVDGVNEYAMRNHLRIFATGYDGSINANVRPALMQRKFHIDLTSENFRSPTFDWGMCIEVMEHIPQEHEFQTIANLFGRNGASPKNVIISWAARGQPGSGHVNCRSAKEVELLFTKILDFRIDENSSMFLRNASKLSWLQLNLIVFRAGGG